MKLLAGFVAAVALAIAALVFLGWYAEDAGWLEQEPPKS